MRRLLLTLCALAATGAMAAAPASAKELIYGSWLGTNNKTNTDALVPYFDMVKEATNGEIEWKMVGGAQLANGPATPEAVGSNLMDAGLVMAPYQPRMLPATNLVFSQSLVGDDYLASVGAMNELLMLDCPECQAEFKKNDAAGFIGYGTTPYMFLCRGEVKTVEDLKGLKIRGSGGGVNIIEIAGGTPVSMPPSDATSALERGTLDCVLGSVAWLTSFGYIDVVDSVIQSPMGMGGPPIMMYVNRDIWESMTPEQRQAHIDHAPDLVTMETFDAQIATDDAAIAKAKEKGITFVPGNNDFAAIMTKRDEVQYGINADNARNAGVKDPERILDAYLKAYDKWKALVKDEIGNDREKFREVLWREVYSKVDPESL